MACPSGLNGKSNARLQLKHDEGGDQVQQRVVSLTTIAFGSWWKLGKLP